MINGDDDLDKAEEKFSPLIRVAIDIFMGIMLVAVIVRIYYKSYGHFPWQ